MKTSAYEKRVKRRITGREHDFFAVCSPGLKKVCKNEMLAMGFAEDHINSTPGGIEFKGKLLTCMDFNLNLRSASRILMRVSEFKADSFEKLERKLNTIDWILYLPKNSQLKFSVTTRKSRLYHSDAIAQRCERVILNQLSSNDGFTLPGKKNAIQTIYVRAENNEFTISLDSTGELLFKRGLKKKVDKAPLRENLAFAMLNWAGFSANDVLIDPMCGSGTFSLEALMMQTKIPPGSFRSFAFENWPGFSQKTYAYMKTQAKENCLGFSKKTIFASDIDDHALAAMKENISTHDFHRYIEVSKKDFFSVQPSLLSPGKKGVVMLNPPYGKRLGESDTRIFFQEIGKKLACDFKGWRAGIIVPSRESKSDLGLKLELKPIFHGGLDVFAGIGIL